MNLSDADDLTLVRACQSGDGKAFRVLMERYQRKIFGVAMGVLRNQEDALDVVQEVLIKVHRYIGRFEGNSSFYTWLYRIVCNLCIDHIRKTKRHRSVELDDGLGQKGESEGIRSFGASSLVDFGDPSELLQRKEILLAVESSLDRLSENHRAVLVMRELQGLSYDEMASAMECSKGTIMSRLFHARRNMQILLAEQLQGLIPTKQETEQPKPVHGKEILLS